MLTIKEKNIIKSLPLVYQEFLNAKFKTRLSVYSAYDLNVLVKELVNDILFSSGVKDKNDQKVKDYLTKTLTEDLQHHKFSNVTFDEIEIACKKGVRQEYGVYMGVNIQTIHSWIKAYLNSKERETAIKEFYIKTNEVEYGKQDKMTAVNPEGQKKVLEILKASVARTQADYQEKRQEAKKTVEKSPRNQYIQKCFTEFDALASKNPSKDEKGKIIPGKYIDMEVTEIIKKVLVTHVRPVDQAEYAQIKLKEYDSLSL